MVGRLIIKKNTMFKLKVSLFIVWLLLWSIAIIEHYAYKKELSVYSATLLLTLLILSFNVNNTNKK